MKKAFIQLHVAVFLAGFTAILGKLINLNEGLLVWYRMLLTAATLLVILYFQKRLQILSFKLSCKLLLTGNIVALHWVSFYGSIKYSNVSVSVTCLSAMGFFTAIFDPLITRRKIDLVEILLGLLAIAGIYLIFDFYPQYKLGILLGIISALLATLFPIINKGFLKTYSPETVTLYEMIGGFAGLSLIMPFYHMLFPAHYYLPSTSDWLWLLVLAWFCTVYSFILQLNALKKISPFTANLSYNLEPVYSIILAFVFFHENKFLSAGFYYGLLLIIFAVFLQTLRFVYKLKRQR